MFSTVLDVAIGMIFIYLLLSLMCSAANEIIELMLKKRAIDLERGIREMLVPGSKFVKSITKDTKSEAKNSESGANDNKSDPKDIVQELYNHSLIRNLFDRRYETSRIASWTRFVWRTHLPSYIPARSFALALMDLVGSPATPAAGAPPATPPPSGTTGSTPPPPDFKITLTQPPPAPPTLGTAANPLTMPLRQGIASSPLLDPVPEVRQGLIALVDAAGNDVAKARENIETWFNNAMDRVSSWYKRRTQVVILILGLFLAVALNADSVTIAKKLSTDESLRESLVAASTEYAKAHASPTPEPQESKSETTGTAPNKPDTETKSETSGSASTKTDAEASRSAAGSESSSQGTTETTSQSIPQECIKDPNSKDCQEKARKEACKKPDSPQCKFLLNLNTLEGLNLPIGWGPVDDIQHKWPGWHWKRDGGWWDQIYWHGLGWLLTALAISLGAPFWFDLLNKFIVIRSAVKPHEKSPEEESKG